MPRRKCDIADTDVCGRPPRGRSRTEARPPDWPRVGDHVLHAWTDAAHVEGIVLEANDRGWDPPVLMVLTKEGKRVIISSPNVRVLARRRRPRRKACKRRKAVV